MNNATTTQTTHQQESFVSNSDPTVLTKADRCDRCGAEAIYVVGLNDFKLYMCKHHFDANQAKLMEDSWVVLADNSQRLIAD